ncbi:MAG: hypothetical protein AABM42_07370 [Actinomycetota bacterium]
MAEPEQTNDRAEPAEAAEDPREARKRLIRELREARGSDALIAYVTSTRPNAEAMMAMDAVRCFIDHIPDRKVGKLDLFIHTNGGEGTVPWRLINLLRAYAEKVDVLVPNHALSAGTLTALGADEIIMHPMGILGPIDPSVHDPHTTDPQTGQPFPVSVEDVAAYNALVKDDVGIRHEDELVQAFALLAQKVHPLTLGHAKRGTAQARMLGEKLLRLRDSTAEAHRIESLIDHLTTKLYYHGHPINRREAREDLGLHVVDATPQVEKAMWDLYLDYERQMLLNRMFDPIGEAISQPGFALQAGQWAMTRLPTMYVAAVESEGRADILEQDLQAGLGLQPDGSITANVTRLRTEWVTTT